MLAFHYSHFGATAANHFTTTFLELPPNAINAPAHDDGLADEEEDDLGYYSDGVKRTLTDEQIAMFRHSEIQALLRERRHAAETRSANPSRSTSSSAPDTASYGEREYGEEAEESGKQGRKRHRKKKHQRKREVKPDLRKRTWDMVDEGVGTLSYEDADSVPTSGRGAGAQRKRVSYDDM